MNMFNIDQLTASGARREPATDYERVSTMSKSEIIKALAGVPAPGYTAKQLHERYDCGVSQAACAVAISALVKAGTLVKHGDKNPHSYTLKHTGQSRTNQRPAAQGGEKPAPSASQEAPAHGLAQPGHPIRTIEGITIEHGIPIPPRVHLSQGRRQAIPHLAHRLIPHVCTPPGENMNEPQAAASLKPAPIFKTIARDQIAPSQTHIQQMRRARFDMPALTDLAANIRAMGILQPIVVRPVANANIPYEIVAGERRYIAAGLADLDTVPASIVDISDEEALEMQLVENLQREGLHDLEEAEGYAELMRIKGLNAEEIGEKIGKSRSYIYSKLKYQQLGDDARAAFYAGSIDASKALLLARISNPKLQARALDHFIKPDWGGQPPSYRSCMDWVRNNMATVMQYIPFPLSADDLPGHRVDHLGHSAKALTTLPACTGCDHFIEATDRDQPICLQPSCFKQKTKAGIERVLEESRQAGHTVVTDREININELIELDDVPEGNADGDDGRTLREILEDNLPEIITVHMTSRDRVESFVRARDAIPIAQAGGVKFENWFISRHSDHDDADESGDDEASRAAYAKAEAARQRRDQVERKYREALFRGVWAKWKGPLKRDELIALVEDRLEDFDEILLTLATGTDDTDVDIDVAKLKDDELLRLLAMHTVQRCLYIGYEPNDLTAMARRFRIDPVKVKKAVQAEIKAAEKAAKTTEEE